MSDTIFLGNFYGRHDGYDGSVFSPEGICKTITATKGGGRRYYRGDGMRRLGNLYGATGGGFAGMVYDSSEDAPTLTCCQGGGLQPHIMEIIVLGNYMPSNYDSSRVVDGGGLLRPSRKTMEQ